MNKILGASAYGGPGCSGARACALGLAGARLLGRLKGALHPEREARLRIPGAETQGSGDVSCPKKIIISKTKGRSSTCFTDAK